MEKFFLGKGLLPRYLVKIQLQNFKELMRAKLRKRFEMVTKTYPWGLYLAASSSSTLGPDGELLGFWSAMDCCAYLKL